MSFMLLFLSRGMWALENEIDCGNCEREVPIILPIRHHVSYATDESQVTTVQTMSNLNPRMCF